MTRRLLYPAYWASGGTATDPDLDTTAPSYEADKYEEHGWKAEKPPEEWQNFLSQITDQKVIAKMVDGLPHFDTSVTYQNGAVYRKDDKFYVVMAGTGQEILDINASMYSSLVTAVRLLYDNHLAADNPHKDTVDTLVGGGYIKSDVDKFFGDSTDPHTITYHKAQMGSTVHGETATSTGALSASNGGSFTGDVIFITEAVLQSPSKYLHMNKATALLELVNGTYSLGIDANGNGYMVGTSGIVLILSELSLDSITIKYNNSFSLPVPILRANFTSDINDANSVGIWTLDTSATPAYLNGLQVDDNEAVLTFGNINSAVTVHLLVSHSDGTSQSLVKDFSVWNCENPGTSNLQKIVGVSFQGTDPKYFREYAVYPTLNEYQKTMLVNK